MTALESTTHWYLPRAGLHQVLKGFTAITGIPSAIFDGNGDLVASAGWQDICTRFHRQNPQTRRFCSEVDEIPGLEIKLDQLAAEATADSPLQRVTPNLYECGNHLWGAVVRITYNGAPVAVLSLGQVLLAEEPRDIEVFRNHARKYGFPEEDYLAALSRVPTVSREVLGRAVLFLSYVAGWVALLIAKHRELEAALVKSKESESIYRNLLSVVPITIALLEGRVIKQVNDAVLEMFGYSPEELIGSPTSIMYPTQQEWEQAGAALYGANLGRPAQIETRMVRKDGGILDVLARIVRINPEQPDRVVAAIVDVTPLKEALRRAIQSEARLSAIIRAAPLAIVEVDPDRRVMLWNPAAERLFGWHATEVLGRPLPFVQDDRLAESLKLHDEELRGTIHKDLHLERVHKDGRPIDVRVSASRVETEDGQIQGVVGIFEDITEFLRMQRELEERSEQRQALAQAALHLTTSPPRDLSAPYVAERLALALSLLAQGVSGGTIELTIEGDRDWGSLSLSSEDGTCEDFTREARRFLVTQISFPIDDEASGSLSVFLPSPTQPSPELEAWLESAAAFLGATIARLRAQKGSTKLQEQLAQIQRLESIGRLAGGIAHDFNNMLQSILGNCELAQREIPAGHPLHDYLSEIHDSASRAAQLTSHLLTFSRRQTIHPRPIDVNESISSILRVLRRLVREQIELVWSPGADVWQVKLDPHQLDQIVTNLVVNGSDAIAETGKIVIQTNNVHIEPPYCKNHPDSRPGDFVMLSVSDTGCGMGADTLARAFEPFFTTKAPGQGTGLGLSIVYGIVHQNGGFVHAYSEVGQGTTMKVYLPRYRAPEEAPSPDTAVLDSTEPLSKPAMPEATGETMAPQRRATILLVEDEPAVRELVQRQLIGLGYEVLSAGSPGEALKLAETHQGSIDLLLTDVVMPDANGHEMAERLRKSRPGMACLFMSGYPENVISEKGILKPGVHFLSKPFSRSQLEQAVMEALAAVKNTD